MAAKWKLLVFAVIATVIHAKEPSLRIQPNQKTITYPVGAGLALTCSPDVDDPSLIQHMEWLDPRGRKIESTISSAPVHRQNGPNNKGAVIIFPLLMANQAGNYTCQANYAASEQIKTSIELVVYEDIKFVDAPDSQYPVVGKDFTVKCKVHGNPSPEIDWKKSDELITSNNKYVVVPDGLIIKNVTEMDDGVYKCTAVVINTGQIKSKNIKVEVQVPPRISPMSTVSVVEGETASTICKAFGKPPPAYRWIKDRTREDLSKASRFNVKKTSGELIISKVESNDDSVYTCIAENTAGRVEAKVKINVQVKPSIYELYNVTVPIGQETVIVCKAKGRPPPKIVFKKRSNSQDFKVGQQLLDRRIVLEQQFFEEAGESFGTLRISDIRRSDDGLYECKAENEVGGAYKNGHIAVEFPPTFQRTKDLPPEWSWDGRPGNLSCLPEAIPNATIVWKFNDIIIENSTNFVKLGNGPSSHLIVYPRNEPRFYTYYECVATNKLGEARIKIPLKRATIPQVIQQVQSGSITATTIKFIIVPPSSFEGLPLRSFTVQYKTEREHTWDLARNHTWSVGAPFILEGLVPEVTYHFRFAARNDVGLGPWTNAESVTMPRRSEPSEPVILAENHNENTSDRREFITTSPYSDHYELRWKVPADNGDPITNYIIRYCVSTKIDGTWRDSDCSEEIQRSVQYSNYELNNLRPDTTYKIELRAHNTIGDSSPAQIRVRTARGIDPIVPMESPRISSVLIIGVAIGGILVLLILVDLMCCCFNRAGIMWLLCNHSKSKHDEEDPKLGREEREPLKQEGFGEKQMSVEFDGKFVHTKTGEIIGKNSAV